MSNLVYLSPVRWADFAQRPHKFAEWHHACHRGKVLWVQPYPSRLPRLADLGRLRTAGAATGQPVPPWMEILDVPALPVEPLPFIHRLNTPLWRGALSRIVAFAAASDCELVVAKPSRLATHVLRQARFRRTVYDAMDDFPAFHGGLSSSAASRIEQAVAREVDLVYASSSRLRSKFTELGARVVLVRNACDPLSLPQPGALRDLRVPGRIGYVGTLASWFDWDLVASLARSHADRQFRLVGPLHTAVPAGLPANIELLPACAHPAAMREMASFSVGLIPFRENRLTSAVDPVKYYEYRALGVPVLTTAFGEMPAHASEDDGVFVVDDPARSPEVLQRALAHASGDDALAAFREANSWGTRFAQAQRSA